ncbi:MAG TPA: adenylate/guanylate cyclase domain-containing protein [Acidimicrobiia bacterium]|nr:adenylate/guanylate cyclase domain-containing protein [Acidimicrobiia bacterium]
MQPSFTRLGRPETRYVATPHGYVAYQAFGSGDRDIMFITGAITNLDAIWDEPTAVRFLDRLGDMGRVIQFDMMGSGVSDPIPDGSMWLPLEGNVDDVVSVLDAAGSRRAVVYGDTEGGLFAMMLAATYPERVSSLVLVNAFPKILRADDYPIGMPQDIANRLSDQYSAQHGTTGSMLELTAPSVADDQRFRTWWTRYQRLSVPLGLARSTFDWYQEGDVRAALPIIQAPTLIVSRRDARFHRLAYGEYLAQNIPDAELHVVEGADTVPFHAGDFGPTLDAVEQFLTGRRESARTERVLASVLFTDIVGSTSRASELGDQRWLDLMGDHDRIVRSQIERYRGREVKMTGDGAIATFDGPARAIACAVAITEMVSELGIVVRAGIHTGEVEMRDDDVRGLGMHIAARVMDHASRGGVMVSSTVKDLVVGSGIAFEECGTFDLKGVPGTWQLFEVTSLG